MVKKTSLLSLIFILFHSLIFAQLTSLQQAANLPAGIHTFNFGDGDFEAYVDDEGWVLWLQYHHKGGTDPSLNFIQPGNDLPIYDNSPLGTDNSNDLTKWGHGSQTFAASIPDDQLWLRWEGVTSHHSRKIHFESPILGKFQSDDNENFGTDITQQHTLREDHSALLPRVSGGSGIASNGNYTLTSSPFLSFNKNNWGISISGRWNVDDVRNEDGTLIYDEHSTIHRVWVKRMPFKEQVLSNALNNLHDHINGTTNLDAEELLSIKNTIAIYDAQISKNESTIDLVLDIIKDYDNLKGPLFVNTPEISKDPEKAAGFELETTMIFLEQAAFDFIFTLEIYNQYPNKINNFKYKSCENFPGDIDPPSDVNKLITVPIRANFQKPTGTNPSLEVSPDGEAHAFRPTGAYLAPGSVAQITVPESLVNKDYYVQVGAHEWDLVRKNSFRRLDRITKKFPITSTTFEVFNPLGGAIGIKVPLGATEGIVNISISNAVEAPFFSLKDFYETMNFNAELAKPAPWAVFESDNVMYTIPRHSIASGQYDLRTGLEEWTTALRAMNNILDRQLTWDKHDLYLINDVHIRGGAYSIGYPMSNNPIDYSNTFSTPSFVSGPEGQTTNLHELGHSIRISKFKGESEAVVNFPYVMAMNHGLKKDLDEAFRVNYSGAFNLNDAAVYRMLALTFGSNRDISNSSKNEVRYQQRGYAHYGEIVKLFGWCALKRFWQQEYIDSENGMDHGINDQDTDNRILRFCIATGVDLRPLYHFYGIIPENPEILESNLNQNGIPSSARLYNRLLEFRNLLPNNSTEFNDFAVKVFPRTFNIGPTANPDFAEGYLYNKSLNYNETEAQNVRKIFDDILAIYFPNGSPTDNDPDIENDCEQEALDCNGDAGGSAFIDICNQCVGGNTNKEACQQPYNSSAISIPGKVEAEFYDIGGQDISYSDNSPGNEGDDFRQDDVDTRLLDGSSNYVVGWTRTGEWLEYTINSSSNEEYQVKARVASPQGNGRFHIELDGVDVTNSISLISTNAWNNYQDYIVANMNIPVGEHILKFYIEEQGFNLDYLDFSITTSLQNLDNENLIIYPTPTDGILNISGISDDRISEVEILDLKGRVIQKSILNKDQTIDIGSLESGVYFIKAGNARQKIVKVNGR